MTTTLQDFAATYSQAWADRDPDAIVAMHTADTVFHQHGYAEPATGREAVRAAIAEGFAQVPDLAFTMRRAHLGAEHFVSEYVISGTLAGAHFESEGIDVFTLTGGLIARKDTYIDWLSVQRQLGADLAAAAGLA
ncbi:nuclear transport factor 2 family protein [Paraconexibacter antarcticus]|uniref:Nuclear transport factor 2 family protein n=1 Tax=Paraconexibacter antarcticus TaxID=2949664 RepID=A0ABY5DVR7_9ACTN|nr:nuclear transport factor 2 family protein [Paraconexibacter antarcticus]UTI65167.1 nuclear transport factor 2 family protein [Paraconexibacter antarcticus]